MKDRHAGGRATSKSVTAGILALPRAAKRLIMVGADALAIPTALWAALALKFDALSPSLERTYAYFLVAIVSALLFFSVLGLYRAVTRFVGPKAMLTVLGRREPFSVRAGAVRPLPGATSDPAVGARNLRRARDCCTWAAAVSWPAICFSTAARTASLPYGWRSTVRVIWVPALARSCSGALTTSRSLSSTTRNRCRAAASTAYGFITRTPCPSSGAAAPH